MIVAGLQKLSLVDFPGQISAVIFLQGCNFKCGYCQNPDLIAGKGSSIVNEAEVLQYLTKRKDKIGGVVITGGEPTVHGDLAGFLEKIAMTGLKIKLDTNGSNPAVLKSLLASGILDYVAVDIKTSFQKYDLFSCRSGTQRDIAETVRICLDSNIPYEFRTTCAPGVLDLDDFREIGKEVKGARKYCLQQFRPDITFDPAFSKVKPFTAPEIQSFVDVLSGYVEKIETRGF